MAYEVIRRSVGRGGGVDTGQEQSSRHGPGARKPA